MILVGHGVLLYRVDALLKDTPDLLFYQILQKTVYTNKRKSESINTSERVQELFARINKKYKQNISDVIIDMDSVCKSTIYSRWLAKSQILYFKLRRYIFRNERNWRRYTRDW